MLEKFRLSLPDSWTVFVVWWPGVCHETRQPQQMGENASQKDEIKDVCNGYEQILEQKLPPHTHTDHNEDSSPQPPVDCLGKAHGATHARYVHE